MMRNGSNVIPFGPLRALMSEPMPAGDRAANAIQGDRIRRLFADEPLHVKRLARRLLKQRWDTLAAKLRKGPAQ